VGARDSAMMVWSRDIFRVALRPLGAARLAALWRAGLPEEFQLPLEFLFLRKISAADIAIQSRVEKMRTDIEGSGRTFQVVSNTGQLITRTARDVTRSSSVAPEWGMFLYLCAKSFRSRTIIELGTSIGISSSYLVSSGFCERFVGVEGSTELSKIATENTKSILPTATILPAMVDDVLAEVVSRWADEVDLLYIDANHNFEPTLRYMDRFGPRLKPGALVIFDDIHWSKEMWEAWSFLRNRQGFSNTIDVGRFGLGLWQGGTVQPKQFSLARYAGWMRKYSRSSSPLDESVSLAATAGKL